MLNKSYTDRFYSYHSKYISNALSLRQPQEDSLESFAKLCDIISLKKNPNSMQDIIDANCAEYEALPTEDKKDKFLREKATDIAADFYADDLSAAKEYFKTLGSFERDFPSICFALATGIGKTRLKGACIAYLR